MMRQVKHVTSLYLYLAGVIGGAIWLMLLTWEAFNPEPTTWDLVKQRVIEVQKTIEVSE